MKLMKLFSFFLIVALAGLPVLSAAGEKYAYVDLAKVFDGYQKTKDNDKTLQEAGKKKEGERDGIVHEIRQMKDELALLSEDARVKKQELLEAKLRDLAEFDRGARRDLGEQRNTLVTEISNDIDDLVKRFGERKGYDYILNERALVFHRPELDVTAEVLAELNKEYAKKRK